MVLLFAADIIKEAKKLMISKDIPIISPEN